MLKGLFHAVRDPKLQTTKTKPETLNSNSQHPLDPKQTLAVVLRSFTLSCCVFAHDLRDRLAEARAQPPMGRSRRTPHPLKPSPKSEKTRTKIKTRNPKKVPHHFTVLQTAKNVTKKKRRLDTWSFTRNKLPTKSTDPDVDSRHPSGDESKH